MGHRRTNERTNGTAGAGGFLPGASDDDRSASAVGDRGPSTADVLVQKLVCGCSGSKDCESASEFVAANQSQARTSVPTCFTSLLQVALLYFIMHSFSSDSNHNTGHFRMSVKCNVVNVRIRSMSN